MIRTVSENSEPKSYLRNCCFQKSENPQLTKSSYQSPYTVISRHSIKNPSI